MLRARLCLQSSRLGSFVRLPIGMEGPVKRPRLSSSAASSSSLLDISDWEQLAASYKAHDSTRELVIKRCRDMQKLSKNAIFSLHRGDLEGAEKQITAAKDVALELLPTVKTHPSLRQGSFANACEEFAEALIFQVYLTESRVMPWKECEWLTCQEYMGGLKDFTGELGRLAVARATERDEVSVATYQHLLDDLALRTSLLDLMHPNVRKKQAPVQATFAKVQRLSYELSLLKRNGLMGAHIGASEPLIGPGAGRGEMEDQED